ncbi:hypothetical protein OAF54_03415 [bacterium]|nr:hypothetical protein [bacterium]
MPVEKNIKIIKVPNTKKTYHRVKNFPKMPILYLELLENKDKVKAGKENDIELIEQKQYEKPSEYVIEQDEKFIQSEKRKNEEQSSENFGKILSDHVNDSNSDERDNDDVIKNLINENKKYETESPRSTTPKNEEPLVMEQSHTPTEHAPSLQQLQTDGKIEIPKVPEKIVSQAEKEEQLREYIFKFYTLRKAYKNTEVDIPTDVNMYSDLASVKKLYDETVKKLSLDSNVDKYKKYLIMVFFMEQFILGKVFGLDMEGFVQEQLVGMDQYEKLLIELGEKHYVPENKQWSVEWRLAFIILTNTVVFIVGKIVNNSISSFFGNAGKAANVKPKKKMRGPSININDLPEI